MTTDTATAPNAAQVEYWNTTAGQTWVRFHCQLDRQIGPLGRQAMDVLAPLQGERILDIGCGCGHTTVELAARVGPDGSVLGVDISHPMLDVARERPLPAGSGTVSFRAADAQVEAFPEASFDAAYSRFGVMFFENPTAAFVNIRKALRPGGRLTFVCWRSYSENDWMRLPMEAAQALLPPIPPSDPAAPGPFAFADTTRVQGILEGAGFSGLAISPFDARIGGGDLDQTLELTFRVGPLGMALRQNPELAPKVSAAVQTLLEGHLTDDGVKLPAAVWIVSAVA